MLVRIPPLGSAGAATMTVVPKRAYTLEFKLSVVEWVESNQQSYRAAARQFGLDRKIIRTWVGRKASLVSALATHGPKRKKVHRGQGPSEQGDSVAVPATLWDGGGGGGACH